MKILKASRGKSIILPIIILILSGTAIYPESNLGLPPIKSLFHGISITYPHTGRIKAEDSANTGYFRKKFVLPEGKIFSAVVNVPHCSCDLHVNGRMVYEGSKREGKGASGYWLRGIDISSYMETGDNIIGIHMLNWPYHAYLFGNVIMDSGEIIPLVTDKTWEYRKDGADRWNAPGTEDENWQPVREAEAELRYFRGQMPSYTGRLRIENPYEQKLFFSDSREISFRIHVPSGLEKERPVLRYSVNCADTGEEKASGEIKQHGKNDTSLVYNIQAGRMERGVYIISLILGNGDAILERRDNEVFIVYGKIPQKEVPGDYLTQGLNLTLYDTINCYDPDDPHPYMEGGEGKSSIVKKGKLVYREAPPLRGKWRRIKDEKLSREKNKTVYTRMPSSTGFFAYKVTLDKTDTPYLIEFHYPDDKNRSIQFQINEFPYDPEYGNVWGYCRESAGVTTGGIFPLSHGTKSTAILFFPARKEIMLTVSTQKQDMPAAASKIVIYEAGDMPAVRIEKSNRRLFGMYTERAYSFRKMLDGYIIGNSNAPKYAVPEENQSLWETYWSPEYFSMWFRTIERFTRYLRFKGENLYIAGCYQYCETNTPYAFSSIQSMDSRMEPDFREIMARVFGENGIFLMAGMEIGSRFSIVNDPMAQRSDTEVAEGAETIWTVNEKGEQVKSRTFYGWKSTVGNVFHPLVQEAISGIVDELCQKLASYPSFKGFYFVNLPGWNFAQNPLGGYEDYTVNLFEKETGMKIPVDKTDPERFKKRHAWLTSHAQENTAYTDWKCRKIKDIQTQLLEKVRSYRDDLKIISRYGPPVLEPFEGNIADYCEHMKKQYGVALSLYKNENGIGIGRMSARYDSHKKALAYQDFKNRIAISPTGAFDENHLSNPAVTDEWNWKDLMVFGPAVPAGEHYGEEFVRMLAESDPNTIVYAWCDDQIFPGHEQAIRNFTKGFLPLPDNELSLLKGKNIDSNILVRIGNSDESTFLCAANPGWWNSEVEIEIERADRKSIIDLTTGSAVESENTRKSRKIRVNLPPYGTRSFLIPSRKAEIAGVKVRPDVSAVEGLEELIRRNEKKVYAQNVGCVISQTDLSFLQDSLKQAGAALEKGDYAEGWSYIANRKFNELAEKINAISYIRPWLIIGPFPNNEDFLRKEKEAATAVSEDTTDEHSEGFHIEFEVEKDVIARGSPDRNKEYADVNGRNIRWREAITVEQNGRCFMDFRPLFKPDNWTVGYAWTKVYSDKDQKVFMVAGSDDGVKIWLNGKMAINVLKSRAALWGDDKAGAMLKKGENLILVKVENRTGGFGFYMDFVDEDDNILDNIRYSTGK